MIDIEAKLSGNVLAALDKYEKKVMGSVIFSGAAAMARVIYDEVKLNTSGARKGGPGDPPGRLTSTLHDAVYRAHSPERSSETKKTYAVSVNKSKARHWWLIEFGSSRHPAHPYIRPALSRVDDAMKAGNARMRERLASGGVD